MGAPESQVDVCKPPPEDVSADDRAIGEQEATKVEPQESATPDAPAALDLLDLMGDEVEPAKPEVAEHAAAVSSVDPSTTEAAVIEAPASDAVAETVDVAAAATTAPEAAIADETKRTELVET